MKNLLTKLIGMFNTDTAPILPHKHDESEGDEGIDDELDLSEDPFLPEDYNN